MSRYPTQPTPDLSSFMDEVVIGSQLHTQRRREMLTYDMLNEVDQQIQIGISGTAGSSAAYVNIVVPFDINFQGGTLQRSSTLRYPHFTYGYTISTPDPILVWAMVTSWIQDDDPHSGGSFNNLVIGANVAWGSSAPNAPPGTVFIFSGVLHLNFQGLGSPPEVEDQVFEVVVPPSPPVGGGGGGGGAGTPGDRLTFEATASFLTGAYPLADGAARSLVISQPEGATTHAANVSPSGVPSPTNVANAQLTRAHAPNGTVAASTLNMLQNASGLGQNAYYPTNAQLATFLGGVNTTLSRNSLTAVNPYWPKVTGQPFGPPVAGVRGGNNFTVDTPLTTGQLIQWATHKWGIPTVLGFANMAWEGGWQQPALGSYKATGSYPWDAISWNNAAGYSKANASPGRAIGLSMPQWDDNAWALPMQYIDPMRYLSTAFALDFWAASWRSFYDNPSGWALKFCNNNASTGQGPNGQDYITGESLGNAGGSILNWTNAQLAPSGGGWFMGGFAGYGPTCSKWAAANGILAYIQDVQQQASSTTYPGFGLGGSNVWSSY